jgi:hypothetical protein
MAGVGRESSIRGVAQIARFCRVQPRKLAKPDTLSKVKIHSRSAKLEFSQTTRYARSHVEDGITLTGANGSAAGTINLTGFNTSLYIDNTTTLHSAPIISIVVTATTTCWKPASA